MTGPSAIGRIGSSAIAAGVGTARSPAGVVVAVGTPEREDPHVAARLTGVTVTCSRTAATTASLVFIARRDADGRWPVQDDERFTPWTGLVVEAAFGTRREALLHGYVREVRAGYPATGGAATVTVVAQDRTLALDREHVRRVWEDTTDRTVVAAILAGHRGIRLHPDSGTGLRRAAIAQDATDIRFIRQRAAANGYECYLYGDTLYFGPPRFTLSAQPALIVAGGTATTCTACDIVVDAHRPEAIGVQCAPDSGGRTVERIVRPDLPLLGVAAADGGGSGLKDFVWRLRHLPAAGENELVTRARGLAGEQSLRVRAHAEIDGDRYGQVLRVGEPVRLAGVGSRFSGRYYVDEVVHRLDAEGYRQSATLLRNAYGDEAGAR